MTDILHGHKGQNPFRPGHLPLKFIVFVALLSATFGFAFQYDRYFAVGPELLLDPDFTEGFASWEYSGPDGSVVIEESGWIRLSSNDPAKFVSLTQVVRGVAQAPLLRFSGEVRTEGVRQGEKGWHAARLILSSHDNEGNWVPSPHHVVSLVGSHDWKCYGQVFSPADGADTLQASAQLAMASGSMWIRNLSLHAVEEKTSHVFLQAAGIGLWGMYLLWLISPYFTCARGAVWKWAVVASFAMVLTGKSVPGECLVDLQHKGADVSHQILRAASSDSTTPAPHRSAWKAIKAANGGHVVLFVLLGVCLVAACPVVSWKTIFFDTGILAGATELLQFFIRGRTPLFSDWLLDLAGISIGLLLCFVFRKIWRGEQSA